MVADVDGDDGVGRAGARTAPRTRRPPTRRGRGRPRPGGPSPRARSPTARRRRRAGRSARGPRASRSSSARSADGGVAEHADGDGVEPADRGRGRRRSARSACTARCRCGWRTTPRRRAAGRTRSSASCATGVPLRPSTPAPSGCVSGTRPLALNVVSTGACEPLGERDDLGASAPRAPCPTMITGRRAAATSRPRRVERGRRRRDRAGRRSRPCGRAGGGVATAGPAPRRAAPGGRRRGRRRACLTASGGQLGVVADPACTVAVRDRRRRGTPPTGRGPGRRRGRAPSTAPGRRSRAPARRRAWRRTGR